MFLVSAGDVRHDDLVKQAEVLFSELPNKSVQNTVEPFNLKSGSYLHATDWQRLDLIITFEIPTEISPYTNQYKIIGNMLGRQLNNSLRNEHKLVYSASAGVYHDPENGYLACNISMTPDKLDQVLNETFKVYQDFLTNTGRDELNIFINQEEEWVAEGINDVKEQGEFFTINISSGRGYVPYDSELKEAKSMTKDEIDKRFKEMLSSNACCFVAGPIDKLPDIDQKIKSLRMSLGIEDNGSNPYNDFSNNFNMT